MTYDQTCCLLDDLEGAYFALSACTHDPRHQVRWRTRWWARLPSDFNFDHMSDTVMRMQRTLLPSGEILQGLVAPDAANVLLGAVNRFTQALHPTDARAARAAVQRRDPAGAGRAGRVGRADGCCEQVYPSPTPY